MRMTKMQLSSYYLRSYNQFCNVVSMLLQQREVKIISLSFLNKKCDLESHLQTLQSLIILNDRILPLLQCQSSVSFDHDVALSISRFHMCLTLSCYRFAAVHFMRNFGLQEKDNEAHPRRQSFLNFFAARKIPCKRLFL